jgi:hypothetical protein
MTEESTEMRETIPTSIRTGLSKSEDRTLRTLATERSVADLRADSAAVDRHFARLVGARSWNEFLDIALARKITDLLKLLIEDAETYSPDQRALLNGAIQYFLVFEDHDDDFSSSIGLEDDARVANTVAAELGRPNLQIDF